MAVVPMKPLVEAKARLAVALEGPARAQLSKELLVRTLGVLSRSRGIGRIAVISRDEKVLRIARRSGAWAIYETGRGLNQALDQATRVAAANGVRAVLVLPADIPGLDESDVKEIINLGREPPCVVIAPDRRDSGTNALLINPIGLISYAFGENSFASHQSSARLAGRVEIYRSDRIGFDLDLPEDVEALSSRPWGSRAVGH